MTKMKIMIRMWNQFTGIIVSFKRIILQEWKSYRRQKKEKYNDNHILDNVHNVRVFSLFFFFNSFGSINISID